MFAPVADTFLPPASQLLGDRLAELQAENQTTVSVSLDTMLHTINICDTLSAGDLEQVGHAVTHHDVVLITARGGGGGCRGRVLVAAQGDSAGHAMVRAGGPGGPVHRARPQGHARPLLPRPRSLPCQTEALRQQGRA